MSGDLVLAAIVALIIGIDLMRSVLDVRRWQAKSPDGRRAMRLRREEKLRHHLDKWANGRISNLIEP